MTPRKRLVLISASAGGGFALVLFLVWSALTWYANRPAPWNKEAMQATFDYLETEGEDMHLVLHYVLESKTTSDYHIAGDTNIVIMEKTKNGESLTHKNGYFKIHYPIFIPAKQRVHLPVHISLNFRGPDYVALLRDPDFLGLPVEEKKKLLLYLDKEFKGLPLAEQDDILSCIEAARIDPEMSAACATEEQKKRHRKNLAAYLNEKLPNNNGFVLFDRINRYQINFPKDW